MCFNDKNLKGGGDGVNIDEPPKRRFLAPSSPNAETKEEAQKRKSDAKLVAATRTLNMDRLRGGSAGGYAYAMAPGSGFAG